MTRPQTQLCHRPVPGLGEKKPSNSEVFFKICPSTPLRTDCTAVSVSFFCVLVNRSKCCHGDEGQNGGRHFVKTKASTWKSYRSELFKVPEKVLYGSFLSNSASERLYVFLRFRCQCVLFVDAVMVKDWSSNPNFKLKIATAG